MEKTNNKMRKGIKYILLIYLLFGTSLLHATVTYRTAELQRLAHVIKIDESVLKEGSCILSINGSSIHVRVGNNIVNHIGLHLFSNDLRKLDNSPILDFLERYFLQLQFPHTGRSAINMLQDDHVIFVNGSISTINNIKENDAFSYKMDNNQYEVEWKRQGKVLIEVTFPVNYQLISGYTLIEAEKLVENEVKLFPQKEITPSEPISGLLAPTQLKDYFILKGNFYYHMELNGNLYYYQNLNQLSLVKDSTYPIESCANMMLDSSIGDGYTLHITQHLYGMAKKTYDLPLSQWIAWCRNNGCYLFFCVENMDNDMVNAFVLVTNLNLNYNHLLSVKIPIKNIELNTGEIEAELRCFIPIHNISNLFSNKKTKSNYKIYER